MFGKLMTLAARGNCRQVITKTAISKTQQIIEMQCIMKTDQVSGLFATSPHSALEGLIAAPSAAEKQQIFLHFFLLELGKLYEVDFWYRYSLIC